MHDGNIKYVASKIVGMHGLVVKASKYGLVFGIVLLRIQTCSEC